MNINKNIVVSTIEWMLNHSGVAIAKKIDNGSKIEILKYSENCDNYKSLEKFAQDNGYCIVHGAKCAENKFGCMKTDICN